MREHLRLPIHRPQWPVGMFWNTVKTSILTHIYHSLFRILRREGLLVVCLR